MNLDWKMRIKVALGIAKALNYLQNIMEPPILDCYIEPSNIWLDKDGTPKLSSFGIASMFPSCKTMGYYKWAAEVAHESDIYGFGVLMLTLLYGNKEFFRIDDGAMSKFAGWVRVYICIHLFQYLSLINYVFQYLSLMLTASIYIYSYHSLNI